MGDNLIFYINKLSYVIVNQELESEKNQHSKKKDERFFNNCVKKVRQIGCDVLLNKIDGTSLEDPCVTDYGGNWSPMTLITDYGRELQAQGAGKANDLLVNCITILKEKQYDCVNDLLKLLLLLKRPLNKEPSGYFQNDLSFSGSDFLLNKMDSLSILSDDFSSENLSKASSFKKALHYEESWTKHFDTKFQLLGECSKKNLLSLDKVSLSSLLSSKSPMVNLSQSHTNSFVFTDFFHARNYKSDKSLFNIYSNISVNETPLLDSFVDHPISHKLPSLPLNSKISSKSGFLELSNSQLKRGLHSRPKEKPSNESTDSRSVENSKKSSMIELKRNSNCSHSFSILYNKSANSQHSSLGSNDSMTFLKSKKRDRDGNLSQYSNSKDIILGLWEAEQSLIKEFRPELANSFPTLRMITATEFVEDVKYLFTGINSGTFQYDTERNTFNMAYGTCLDDVTPESLYYFSKDFIEVGNCYVKLTGSVIDIGKNNFDTCTTISQAFWKSIFDYLELHYSLVLEIPVSTNLMSLKSCTRDLHEIITTVANISKVFQPQESLPEGGELLTYLLKIAERINKQCVTNIVFGILQNCCSVYFAYILQNWMFKGQLDSQSNDFFVDYRRQKIKMKSRAYYNSFFLIDEKIPSFLRGYEESIYNCGKSIHFLKLFNVEDKFCQLLEKADCPVMRVCFSEEQLEKLEVKFKDYEDRTLKTCGERITIKTIRDEEKEKERAYLEYIRECKIAQEKQREENRLRKLEEENAKRKKQSELLKEQINFIKAEKERKRQEEEAEKLKLEDKIKKAEETRENLLNKEKSLLKNYYEKTLRCLDKKIILAETKKESMRKIISDTDEWTLDIINDNEIQIDSEGNITSEVDINLNSNPSYSEKLFKINEEEKESESHFLQNSMASVDYDENSNPSSALQIASSEANTIAEKTNKKSLEVFHEAAQKSASYRTVASEEAERNKCKVLKSEFELSTTTYKPLETKRSNLMSALEKNRRKVLESEYNILLKAAETHISLKTASRPVEITKVDSLDEKLPKSSSESFKSSAFKTVSLERKPDCADLGLLPDKTHESQSIQSESSESFLTPPNEFLVENVSNSYEELENLHTPEGSSVVLNEKYQDALTRDMEIFHHKFSHRNIFCNLKEEELDSLPCTDFLKFQRFLRKSALIPLRVQEKLANDALLKHLLKGENLLSHLKSLRGYFFLNDGEFGRSFTHHTFRSLAKCTEATHFFERSNLSNIVNEALNYTIHNFEPNSQNLSFRIVKMPPFLNHSSHDVLSPFELSYRVDWPLNMILTEKALNKYRKVFRFLLKLKRINWTLNENFLLFNYYFKSKRLKGKILIGSSHYHKIQIYRHAMTQVMTTLDEYIFSNGVQFPWIFFLRDLETTENIDDLYQKHVRYIKDVLTRCFLSKNSEELLDCIHNLIELALKFHYTAKSSAMEVVDGKYVHPKFSVLKATFCEFCSVIKAFLKTLKEKISSNQVIRSHYVLIEKFDLKLM